MAALEAYYRKNPAIRVRPMPDQDGLLVFASHDQNIFHLNATAWLIFELCHNRSRSLLQAAYLASIPSGVSHEEAITKLEHGLALLEENSLITRSTSLEGTHVEADGPP